MKVPVSGIVLGTRSSRAEYGLVIRDNFRLNKKVAESRVNFIGGGLSHNNFRITGDIQFPAFSGTIGDADSSQLDIIFRRNGNLGVCIDIVIAPVLVGGKNTATLIDGSSLTSVQELGKLGVLCLESCNILKDSYIRLTYRVVG